MDGKYIVDLRACSVELNKIQKWIKSHPFDSNAKYLISYAVIKASGTIEHILNLVSNYGTSSLITFYKYQHV